jgi:hypothetical protein
MVIVKAPCRQVDVGVPVATGRAAPCKTRTSQVQPVIVGVIAQLAPATVEEAVASIGIHQSQVEAGFDFGMGRASRRCKQQGENAQYGAGVAHQYASQLAGTVDSARSFSGAATRNVSGVPGASVTRIFCSTIGRISRASGCQT